MIGLKWAKQILAKGYDSSNRPKEGVTKAKINGKVVTIGYNGSFKKKEFITYDRYENQTPVEKKK